MTHPNGGGQGSGGNGDGGGPSTSAQEQQYELLGFIQILSFTAAPPQVAPFEPTTLSWTVRLPTTLHVPVSLGVAGQMSHGTSGSATVTPFATTQYGLTAQTAIVSRAIGSLTVPVAASACQSSQVNNQVQTAINQAQQSDSQGRAFTLTALTLAPDGIAFTICPLPAASPHPVHPVSGPPGQGPVEPAS